MTKQQIIKAKNILKIAAYKSGYEHGRRAMPQNKGLVALYPKEYEAGYEKGLSHWSC